MKNLFIFLFLFIAFVSHAQTVSITSSVPSNTFCAGANVTFTASTTGITNPTYQWYKNSVAISGETNSTYSTNALSQGDQIYVSVATTVSGSLVTSGLKFNFDAGNSSSYGGTGTTLTDLSGNGTHATFLNAPTFVSSPIKTFQWNTRGSNGSNTTKATLSNVLGDDMTVGAWIKTSNIGNDLAHYRLLYILTGEQGGGANDWGFGINRLGKLAFGAGPNDVTISSSTSVNTNEWTYVVATRAKSTGQIKLYINGAFNNSGTGNAGNTLNAQSNITIADGNDGPAFTFEGNISIIEGYNTVLSADDVLANFNANKGRFGISSNLSSNTVTAAVTNLSAPVTVTGDACVNKTTLSTSTGFASYAWYKDNVAISGATTNTFSPIAAGAYKVQVSNGTCSVNSAVTTINTCGVTPDGRMRSNVNSTLWVSTEGGINKGSGMDESGLKLIGTTLIGSAIWSAANLDVSTYRNGDVIPQVTDPTAWASLTTGAWCYYNNDPANGAIYGKLYNWYAVIDSRGLAPEGWHIPTDAEWAALITALGGSTVAGGKMKTTGTAQWKSPNTGATNESGFTGLPAGQRWMDGIFWDVGNYSFWWSKDTSSQRRVFWNNSDLGTDNHSPKSGYSVRVIKD